MQITVLLASLVVLFTAPFCQSWRLDETNNSTREPRCRCGPDDACWPDEAGWDALNTTVGGALVKSVPIAHACYPGPAFDAEQCAYVTENWPEQDFMTSRPIGRVYPYNVTCAPVDYSRGGVPTSCSLGISPRYAVNATSLSHIQAALAFARTHHIRLVVASTGHDLLGRSDGYGSLEVWLRHYRNSIALHETYQPPAACPSGSHWRGRAIQIDGAFPWADVYAHAKAWNVIVVGGGSTSPGATGGWPSGGGHGPATRNYGMGADQILEARVLLADGTVVPASRCQNPDLYRALRGGGPGYGITLSTTVKAYPNVDTVTAHHLYMAPLTGTGDNTALLDAVAVLMQALPDLNEAGFAGYGYWSKNVSGLFPGNATAGYAHGFWTIGKNQSAAEASFGPVKAHLLALLDQTLLSITDHYASYTDYWSFFEAESAVHSRAGQTSLLTSRLLDRAAVANYTAVRAAVAVSGGAAGEAVTNVIDLVSGGQVFLDAADAWSGLHPAWRRSPLFVTVGRGVALGAPEEVRAAAMADMTFVKGQAWKELAPDTGGYMNEGDRNDPDWQTSFYGDKYADHLAAKRKYDPQSVFYCATCVGSDAFVERPDSPLCRV